MGAGQGGGWGRRVGGVVAEGDVDHSSVTEGVGCHLEAKQI